MDRKNLVNIICSLILASLLVLGVLITVAVCSSGNGKLIIESDSGQIEYNGNTLERHYYKIISGNLKRGHTIQAVFTGAQTEIGTSDNTFTVKILDKEGEDVTSEYSLELVFGKLNVIPITITIVTHTAEKPYDGTPLVCEEWLQKGELIFGHVLKVEVVGTQTEIGVSPNKVGKYSICDFYGKDVSKYYKVNVEEGDLIVFDPIQMNGTVGGGSSVDLSGQISGAESGDGSTVCLKVKNDVDDAVYLKLKSFGAYTGAAWNDAIAYDYLINDVFSADYLSSIAIGGVYSHIEIESFTDQYFLPYYMSFDGGGKYTIQTSDVLYEGDTKEIYSVDYSKFDYANTLTVSRAYRVYEQKYSQFVYDQYLAIDDETLSYMNGIISKEGFYSNDLKTILKVAEYIQNSAVYSFKYDKAMDSESNIAVAFLSKYKEGICQHFASAATLLYRAMGIPARYTIGFLATTTAGEWVEVKGSDAHAWVEVYIDGMGWIQIEVTGGFTGSGDSSGEGNAVYSATISPIRVEKLYDGTPLYAENEVDGFDKFAKMGYTYQAVISGSRTELGKSTSVIESFIVYDPYGVDVTDQFMLTFSTGVVHVYKSELVFVSAGATKEYDALALTVDLDTCKLVSGKLENGEAYEVSDPISIVDAMTVYANFKVTIRDEQGNDITDIYKVTKNCGILKITPKNITVKAADDSKAYDGKALINAGYEVIGELGYGDVIYCSVEGRQTSVGRSENIVREVFIYNHEGKDVTSNYSIKLETGTLRVTP